MKNPLTFAIALPLLAGSFSLPMPVNAAQKTPVTARPAPSRSWVALDASTNKRQYTTGEPISVVITAKNTNSKSSKPRNAYLRFTSGQRFDFSIFRAGTNESVYTWSATRMFMQSVGSLWLKPQTSQEYQANIGDEMGTLAPGKYILRARLTNSPRPIEAAPHAFEIVAPALSLAARTDKATYKIGEPVEISASATNIKEAKVVHFGSGLGCDFVVSDENEKPIWTYGANLRFVRALGDVAWKAGETKFYSGTWNGVALPTDATTPTELAPGRYKVQAILQSTPQILAPPFYIELVK